MFWTLVTLGFAGLLIGTLFKVQMLIIASFIAATFIFGEAIAQGTPLLKAALHALGGLALLQTCYVVGVVVGARAVARSRMDRLPQETTN
jgi:hypothetical protein